MARSDGPWVVAAYFASTPSEFSEEYGDHARGASVKRELAHDWIDWWSFILEYVPETGVDVSHVMLVWDRPDGSQMPAINRTVERLDGMIAIRTNFKVNIPYRWNGTLWLNVLVDGIPLTRSPFTVVHR